jgi:hypothetical protein
MEAAFQLLVMIQEYRDPFLMCVRTELLIFADSTEQQAIKHEKLLAEVVSSCVLFFSPVRRRVAEKRRSAQPKCHTQKISQFFSPLIRLEIPAQILFTFCEFWSVGNAEAHLVNSHPLTVARRLRGCVLSVIRIVIFSVGHASSNKKSVTARCFCFASIHTFHLFSLGRS